MNNKHKLKKINYRIELKNQDSLSIYQIIIKLNQLYNQDRKTLRRFKYNMPITKLKKSNTIRRAMNSKLMHNMPTQLKKKNIIQV